MKNDRKCQQFFSRKNEKKCLFSPKMPTKMLAQSRIAQFWYADLFLGGQRLPTEVVPARVKFPVRRPKNLLLHGKNQVGRAPHFWPACQNFEVPCPKLMSCKCALYVIGRLGGPFSEKL